MGKGLGVILLVIGLVAMYSYITNNYSLNIPTFTIGDFGYWLLYGAVILITVGLLIIIFSRPKPRYY